MPPKTKSNVPVSPLRWTVERGAREFRLAPGTLRKNLTRTGAEPDLDGLFSTEQLCEAIYGSMHLEKLRTQRALSRKLELENAITTGSVLNKTTLMQALAVIADAIKSRLMSAHEIPRSVRRICCTIWRPGRSLWKAPLRVKAGCRATTTGRYTKRTGAKATTMRGQGLRPENRRKRAPAEKRG
jgi:hypothetical protein